MRFYNSYWHFDDSDELNHCLFIQTVEDEWKMLKGVENFQIIFNLLNEKGIREKNLKKNFKSNKDELEAFLEKYAVKPI